MVPAANVIANIFNTLDGFAGDLLVVLNLPHLAAQTFADRSGTLFPRSYARRKVGEARPEEWYREVEKGAQFGRHEAVRRIHEAGGLRGRLKILQKRNQLSGFYRFGDEI